MYLWSLKRVQTLNELIKITKEERDMIEKIVELYSLHGYRDAEKFLRFVFNRRKMRRVSLAKASKLINGSAVKADIFFTQFARLV